LIKTAVEKSHFSAHLWQAKGSVWQILS